MINFNTKLDLERQSKILSGHTAIFDGGVSFGIPFSGFPSGVDTGTTILTSYNVVTGETSGYSGTTGTTFFGITPVNPSAFTDSRIILGTSGLTSVITGTTSNYIQTYGPIWDLTSSTIIDEHLVGLTYSGYQITYFFNNVSASTPTTFNAYVDTRVDYYSANTLDYKGSTNWLTIKGNATVDERLTVNRLTITSGASIGYLLSSVDSEGMAEWIPSSGFVFSGGSGNCITDLYVTNVFGCSPITMHDDTIISGTTSKKLGINTSPSYTFEVLSQDGNSKLVYDDTTDSQNLTLSGKTNGLYYVDVAATDVGLLRMGVVGKSYTGVTNFGTTGDSYVYSSVLSNGLNIISSPGGPSSTTNDYIRFYAGVTPTSQPDLHIQGSGATRGNIGIGTTDPQDTLHIKGNAGILTLEGNDHVYMNFYPDGYSAGRKGWFGFGNSPDDNITLTNQTFTGGTLFKTNDIARMFISASGNSGNVGIGTITPSEKLHVYGNTIISTGGTGSRLGINTTPDTTLHAVKNSSYLKFDESTVGPYLYVVGTSTQKPEIAAGDGTVSIGMGVRGLNNTTNSDYGNKGDSYIYSEVDSKGLNIIQALGTGPNYIRFYANLAASNPSHMHIQGTGTTKGYVGIGTESPTEKLHLSGNAIISTGGTGSKLGINITPTYNIDVLGNASRIYMDDTYTSGTFVNSRQLVLSATSAMIPAIVATNNNEGVSIGVRGNSNPVSASSPNLGEQGSVHLAGSGAAKGLNIIKFDYPSSPQSNYIRFYAGQTAESANTPDIHIHGNVSDSNRGYVGIGTITPSEKLDVNGRTKTTTLQITSGAVSGYVLTSDDNGVATWSAAGGGGSSTVIFTTGSTNNNAIYDLVGSHTLSNVSNYSIIAGGYKNKISGSTYSGIFAGSGNTISGAPYSIIVGGFNNSISGVTSATMIGTSYGLIDSIGSTGTYESYEFMGGGYRNQLHASSNAAMIGGSNNWITFGTNGAFIGGSNNSGHTNDSLNTFMIGGQFNKFSEGVTTLPDTLINNSGIIGGRNNTIKNKSLNSGIFAGSGNTINGHHNAFIGGGSNNTIDYCFSSPSGITNESIVGGSNNEIKQSFNSSIIGGRYNSIDNGTWGGGSNGIIGGTGNTMDHGENAVMIGGTKNRIGDGVCTTNSSVSIGGTNNRIYSSRSYTIGGLNNIIPTNISDVVLISCNGLSATTSNMVYVPDLTIDGLVSVIDLQTDASGKVIAGASDIRLKENINQLQNSLSIVKNLRGVSFEYTQESNMGNGLRYGFIAQEVQEFVPDIVRSRVKGDGMLSLSYTEIIPLLVESVKEIATGQTTNVIVEYTPTSSSDIYGVIGEITRDDNYLYVKGNNGWKRTNLESF